MDPPPSYASLPSTRLPDYRKLPAANEHVLQFSSAPAEYSYSSGRLVLNLGPEIWGTAVPSYGRNASVEGHVKVSKLSHVSKVVVSLHCDIVLTQRRGDTTSGQILKSFLLSSTVLYSHDKPFVEAPAKFLFSLPFPESIEGRGGSLPPSFATAFSSVYVDVLYTVKVNLTKKGLRPNEHIKTAILYLPKTRPHSLRYPFMPEDSDSKLLEEACSNLLWQSWNVLPTATDVIPPLNLIIQFSLPIPAVFPAASSIPFSISFSSTSPLLSVLHQIHLIKHVRLNMGGKSDQREHQIGSGHILRVDEGEDGKTVVKGTLKGGKAGSEYSWDLAGYIEVRYTIKLSIKPPTPSLPTYEYTQDVQLTTHDWVEPEELNRPALDMVVPHNFLGTTSSAPTMFSGRFIAQCP